MNILFTFCHLVLFNNVIKRLPTGHKLTLISIKQRKIQVVVQIRLSVKCTIELRPNSLEQLMLILKHIIYAAHTAVICNHESIHARSHGNERTPLRHDHLDRIRSPRNESDRVLFPEPLHGLVYLQWFNISLNDVKGTQIDPFSRVHRSHQILILQQSPLDVVHRCLSHGSDFGGVC